jgi:hypothetical protein
MCLLKLPAVSQDFPQTLQAFTNVYQLKTLISNWSYCELDPQSEYGSRIRLSVRLALQRCIYQTVTD